MLRDLGPIPVLLITLKLSEERMAGRNAQMVAGHLREFRFIF
jgi:hypothetical protein